MKPYAAIAFIFSWVPCLLQAQTPPIPTESPYLRVEAGDHTAMINRLSTDKEGAVLLTVSDDKTARLWNVADGTLRGVMRVPIGDAVEGMIYAGALSPDGKTALLAGHTNNAEETFSLYVYDTGTLKMQNRLSKQPSEILHISYNADGTQFAAAFSRGFRVWDAHSGKKLAEDFSYKGNCNWISFSADGSIATSSDDGMVRIYNPQFQPLHQVKGKKGKQPYGLSFSGEGALLAVGYKDKAIADIIDTKTGKVAKPPTTEGLTGDTLSSVAWMNDDLLAAGGANDKTGRRVIRRWPKDGSKPVDIPVAENTITGLMVLPDQTLAYATAEPSWGIITPEGRALVQHQRPIIDSRNLFKYRFGVSTDGLTVEWSLLPQKKTARFDIARQTLTIDAPRDETLLSPMMEDKSLPVAQWQGTTKPTFKKKAILLGENETSRSLAIAHDHSGFVLGTEHYLRWFDAQGKELAKASTPAEASAVNLSKDGRYLVATFMDGTLRWYRLHRPEANNPATIEEYAALFLSVDGARWIAWAKEGFFAHSMQGGKNLAGYHLNRGANRNPEWIDFGQLYQRFYSPSFLTKKMSGGHETELASEFESAKLFVNSLFSAPVPEVEWVAYCLIDQLDTGTRAFRRAAMPATPPAGSAPASTNSCVPIGKSTTRAFSRVAPPAAQPTTTANGPITEEAVLQTDELPADKKRVRLRFKLKERNGGVGSIHLLRDGVVIENAEAKTRGFSRVSVPQSTTPPTENASQQPAKDADVILERDVELHSGLNRLQVRAYNGRNDANGKSSVIGLVVPTVAAPAQQMAARSQKPILHVLSVGVDKYKESHVRLRFAVKDATDVVNTLEKSKSAEFSKVSVMRLYDEQATRQGIESALEKIAGQINSRDDAVVIYMAGHGMNTDNTYYFIPQNSLTTDYTKTSISQAVLGEKLAALSEKANRIIVFLDSCHSGAYDVRAKDLDRQSESLSKARESFGDLLMIAAAGAAEEAADEYITPDNKPTGNGLFGHVVLSGLYGDAARRNEKKVSALQMVDFVNDKIREIRVSQPKYTQRPAAMSQVKDLVSMTFPLIEIQN